MLRKVDIVFGVLFLLGALGHTIGTFVLLPSMSGLWVWSLGAAIAAWVLGSLNLLRASRPSDKSVALIAVIGTAAWVFIALAFGRSIGNVADPRALFHAGIGTVLVLFGIATLQRSNALVK